jgi:hypothetical protein
MSMMVWSGSVPEFCLELPYVILAMIIQQSPVIEPGGAQALLIARATNSEKGFWAR